MNFIEEFEKGQKGGNTGLYMGEGLNNVSRAVNGVQKGRLYAVAGASKSGKSTFTDYAFVLQPYLDALERKLDVEWIYFSFELNRISKEFDFMAYFLNNDYGIDKIRLENQYILDDDEFKDYVHLSPDYLRGRLLCSQGQIIKVKDSVKEKMKLVYENRIIPLFGEYSRKGEQIKKGLITFITNRDNPTGINKFVVKYAKERGEFISEGTEPYRRITGYKQTNPDKQVIVILDHMRKCIPEQGFQMKQNVDKVLQYFCTLRDLCLYTMVGIIHTNRSISNLDNIKFAKDTLHPTEEDIKDTSNVSEDVDYLFTIFNPNEDKFHLHRHFGVMIRDENSNPLYLNMRTVHLVASRHCIFPQHFRTEMLGHLKTFKQLKIG